MANWTTDELESYLEARYVSLRDITEKTGLASDLLEDLIATGCMPGASYERRRREELWAHINGDADTVSLKTVSRHFAADVITWVLSVAPRLNGSSPRQLAPVLKEELRSGFLDGLVRHGGGAITYGGFMAEDGAIERTGFDHHFATYVWTNWRAGTWGICVHDSWDIRNIARKTVAVERLKRLTRGGTRTSYSPAEARKVRHAMAEYDAIVPPFSPHDRHEASRARLVDALADAVSYVPAALPPTG
ncbi:MAG: DUF6058 family natural product biosynthesis protein [bacterium]|nr:DUF6058 family natural product biosynthesis protein [bacterium]